ncbi:cyclin-dependent kinase inhibitor 3 [Senna tora]|uniref:Cyclin-dependent kinase inhibitor n=1 Tax=Senna tora TaxID=362788 RepID=A0A834TRS1_9FABA|nr:cyclin-dependent kinase inhibitor 3 [Senna tora]
MGKYMKKSKIAGGDVAVMEVSPQSSLGVRTRAKTLALQRLQKPLSPDADASSFSYLQLRSRRLEKVVVDAKRHPPLPRPREQHKKCCRESSDGDEAEENVVDVGIEGFFGENVLEIEGRDRSTRESTPCSLIRDSNAITTPGSTTRKRTSSITNQIIREHIQRNIPSAFEMDEFFSFAEKQQQIIFMEKYNFDIINDVPLPGRYEWVQVLQ